MQMKTISFRIAESQVQALDRLAHLTEKDRTSVLIKAVEAYLDAQLKSHPQQPLQGFGSWQDKSEDGMAYQDRIRAEWD